MGHRLPGVGPAGGEPGRSSYSRSFSGLPVSDCLGKVTHRTNPHSSKAPVPPGLAADRTHDLYECYDEDSRTRNNGLAKPVTSSPIRPPDCPQDAAPSRSRGQRRTGCCSESIASHNYFLLEKFEAGVALRGTEIKSIREGKVNLKDADGLIKDGEAFLLNVHIGPYFMEILQITTKPGRAKLLMHREEVRKLLSKTAGGRVPRSSPPAFTFAMGGSNANWR